MAKKTASEIPVGTQFSPELINLRELLDALIAHSGDKVALRAAIWRPPVHRTRVAVPTSSRNANLPLEAAVQYGLLERTTYEATALTRDLAQLRNTALFEAFGRHVLQKLGGLRVVETVEQMQRDLASGLSTEKVTGPSLARRLTAEGIRVTEQNTQINSLRMWLALAGVFGGKGKDAWKVNRSVKEKLLGLSDQAIPILAGFSEEKRAFVHALCRVNPTGWYSAADVRDLAETSRGVRISRSSLPREVLKPLERAGLIEYRTKGTKGGTTSELKVTPAFDAEVLEPFIDVTIKTLDPVVTAYYRWRPDDIYAGLESSDTFTKGQALEAYAVHVMRLLGLRFVGWRKQGIETGGGEVDVAFSGLFGGLPTLWQVQCKNVAHRTDLEDVAKEVGLTVVTNATHVMFIAKGGFTDKARDFARSVMANSPLTVFLIDESDFRAIKTSPGRLGLTLRERAEEINYSRTHASAQSIFRPAAV